MQRMIAVMMLVAAMMFSALQAIAGEPQKESKFYASAGMSRGYGFDVETNGRSFEDMGVAFSNSAGLDIRLGWTPLSFVSLEGEYLTMSSFTGDDGKTQADFQPTSFFANIKIKPAELFFKNPKISPYLTGGIGTTNLEISAGGKSASNNSNSSSKIGIGVDIPLRKNLYLYSEIVGYHFSFQNDKNDTEYNYSTINIGFGIKF